MPGIVVFRRRWSVGSDDLVLPAVFLFLLHTTWFVILSVVLFGLVYNPNETCSLNLVDHGRGYLGILLSCMIAELAIIWLSMRGSILYTEPRDSMQYVLYVRLAILVIEFVYAIVGIVWLTQYYTSCNDITAKSVTLGMVVCNWVVILSVCITVLCVFDPTGRTFVKLRATKRRQRNLRTYNLRHRLEEGQASSWTRRLKVFLCCTRTKDSQSVQLSECRRLQELSQSLCRSPALYPRMLPLPGSLSLAEMPPCSLGMSFWEVQAQACQLPAYLQGKSIWKSVWKTETKGALCPGSSHSSFSLVLQSRDSSLLPESTSRSPRQGAGDSCPEAQCGFCFLGERALTDT